MKKVLLAILPLTVISSAAVAGTLSSVTCSEYSVSLTFASDIQDNGHDSTKVGVAGSTSGPFMAFSSASTVSVEGSRVVTISLSDDDVINLGPITGGNGCTVQVNSGFLGGVTSTSTASE